MKTLLDIQQQLACGHFEFSRHAFRRVVERNISESEIREAGAKAEFLMRLGQIRETDKRDLYF